MAGCDKWRTLPSGEQTLRPKGPNLTARQYLSPSSSLPWHSHRQGYAAIVLRGGYLEAGDGGRFRGEAGMVLVHPPFGGHANWIGHAGAELVNVPLPLAAALACPSGIVEDPESLATSMARAPDEAAALLGDAIVAPPKQADDLPDRLAVAFQDHGDVRIADWAAARGISPRTLTRQFQACFGMSPAHYRWRIRTLTAWRTILLEKVPLASVAAACGFADQAHMTRSVGALTGLPPSGWRRSIAPALSD